MAPGTAFRGYQALGANVTRYEGGFQRDHHEAIDLYKEAPSMVLPSAPCACLLAEKHTAGHPPWLSALRSPMMQPSGRAKLRVILFCPRVLAVELVALAMTAGI